MVDPYQGQYLLNYAFTTTPAWKPSILECSLLAGLPRILVDIRHEASHNELPSLALLRLGAASALAWLSQSYWQQQADHVALRKSQIVELLQVWSIHTYWLCERCLDSTPAPKRLLQPAPAACG